jgi:aspartate 1-decarboxylase
VELPIFFVTGAAAHLVRCGCFVLVIRVLFDASHAGMAEILAEAVGPTVGPWSCGGGWSGTLVDFGGAAHLNEESCCILVIGVLVDASHAGVTVILAATVGPTVGLYSHVDSRYSRHSFVFGGAAHLIGDGCFILVTSVLIFASHAGVIAILAATVGPTVAASRRFGSSRCVGSSWLRGGLDDFGGAAHLVDEGCCILVIGVLILASHAGVTAIPATTVGPTVAATRRSRHSLVSFVETRRDRSTFVHFDVLFGSRKGGNWCSSIFCFLSFAVLLFPAFR